MADSAPEQELQKYYDNKRIYVLVQEKYHTINGVKIISPGMAAAQVAHAVSKLKFEHFVFKYGNDKAILQRVLDFSDTSITTVVLLCRDKRELQHVEALATDRGLESTTFADDNDEFWGKGLSVVTALAIGPCTKEDAQLVCGYVPLFSCDYWYNR